jgi:hypothetical protein
LRVINRAAPSTDPACGAKLTPLKDRCRGAG